MTKLQEAHDILNKVNTLMASLDLKINDLYYEITDIMSCPECGTLLKKESKNELS